MRVECGESVTVYVVPIMLNHLHNFFRRVRRLGAPCKTSAHVQPQGRTVFAHKTGIPNPVITIIYPHKRKTKSSTYGIAQMVIGKLLSGGTLHEFYLPQDMPHVCAGCYACMNGREDKCGGHEYMQKLIAAMDDSELIIFCAPTYVYHIPGQVKTLLDHFAYRWLVHRPDLSLMRRQALIITTAAGGGMKSTVRDLRDSMNYWGVGRTHVITQAVWGYDWSSMPENFMRKIEQKVEKTVSAIQKNAGNVTPCAKVRSLFYMYRLFHKKRKMNPVDDEYWYQKGYVTEKPWKRGR